MDHAPYLDIDAALLQAAECHNFQSIQFLLELIGLHKPRLEGMQQALIKLMSTENPRTSKQQLEMVIDQLRPNSVTVNAALHQAILHGCIQNIEVLLELTGENKPSQLSIDNA